MVIFLKDKINDKKGITGIGTLIIFIAMILVAAVAAGVIIRTSNVLQQQAYVVGSETRQRIITAIEVFAITANADVARNTAGEFEIYTRLRAGSYPLQFETTGFTFITSDYSFGANFQHHSLDSYYDSVEDVAEEGYSIVGLDDTEKLIDPIVGDEEEEIAYIEYGTAPDGDNFILELSNDNIVNVSLGFELNNATESDPIDANIIDEPLEDSEGTIWGYLTVDGEITTTGALEGDDLNVFISEFYQDPLNRGCSFDTLIPEKNYCVDFQVGGSDETILDSGEIAIVRYKLSEDNVISEDESFEIRFIPKRGTITDLEARTPDSINSVMLKLWP
ncbi:MAG: archaellin/type IV pilin N-terminal domain-containing protein [Candidatus Woesearchaeota archaeon]